MTRLQQGLSRLSASNHGSRLGVSTGSHQGTAGNKSFEDLKRHIHSKLVEKLDFTRVKDLGATTIDIEQDARGRIWFGTWGKGVFCFDEQKHQWRNYLSRPGDTTSLPGNQTFRIASANSFSSFRTNGRPVNNTNTTGFPVFFNSTKRSLWD